MFGGRGEVLGDGLPLQANVVALHGGVGDADVLAWAEGDTLAGVVGIDVLVWVLGDGEAVEVVVGVFSDSLDSTEE